MRDLFPIEDCSRIDESEREKQSYHNRDQVNYLLHETAPENFSCFSSSNFLRRGGFEILDDETPEMYDSYSKNNYEKGSHYFLIQN